MVRHNPQAEGNSKTSTYSVRRVRPLYPGPNRFPSATKDLGFKPLADYVHSLGLKFASTFARHFPSRPSPGSLPIEGSAYHAADAADTSDTCPWNYDNYGIEASKPAGQAYYDSILRLYAGWGVTAIKVDCIASHPYKGDEIRMIGMAIRKEWSPHSSESFTQAQLRWKKPMR